MAQVDVRHKAIDLLSRREHSQHEMFTKLTRLGFEPSEITEVLEALVVEGLLSDERFCDAFIRFRRNKGFGPRVISDTLVSKGISSERISDFLDGQEQVWFDHALEVRKKKFGTHRPETIKDEMKQKRFLQYRGFSFDQIDYALSQTIEEE